MYVIPVTWPRATSAAPRHLGLYAFMLQKHRHKHTRHERQGSCCGCRSPTYGALAALFTIGYGWIMHAEKKVMTATMLKAYNTQPVLLSD